MGLHGKDGTWPCGLLGWGLVPRCREEVGWDEWGGSPQLRRRGFPRLLAELKTEENCPGSSKARREPYNTFSRDELAPGGVPLLPACAPLSLQPTWQEHVWWFTLAGARVWSAARIPDHTLPVWSQSFLKVWEEWASVFVILSFYEVVFLVSSGKQIVVLEGWWCLFHPLFSSLFPNLICPSNPHSILPPERWVIKADGNESPSPQGEMLREGDLQFHWHRGNRRGGWWSCVRANSWVCSCDLGYHSPCEPKGELIWSGKGGLVSFWEEKKLPIVFYILIKFSILE